MVDLRQDGDCWQNTCLLLPPLVTAPVMGKNKLNTFHWLTVHLSPVRHRLMRGCCEQLRYKAFPKHFIYSADFLPITTWELSISWVQTPLTHHHYLKTYCFLVIFLNLIFSNYIILFWLLTLRTSLSLPLLHLCNKSLVSSYTGKDNNRRGSLRSLTLRVDSREFTAASNVDSAVASWMQRDHRPAPLAAVLSQPPACPGSCVPPHTGSRARF